MQNNKPSFLLRFFPWAILLFGFLLTYSLQETARVSAREALRNDFDIRVNEILQYIDKRLQNYEQILEGGVSLFAAAPFVDRRVFAEYVKHLKLGDKYPGIQGVGFSQQVLPQEKSDHIQKVRAQGFPKYDIRPAGERDVYSSIIYLEPFDWRNQRAFGFDMYSEPIRRLAMVRARDEGKSVISGKVQLVQETEKDTQSGFLMYLPVYRPGSFPKTLEERRASLAGWVYAPFRMNDLINGVLGRWVKETVTTLDFEIYDGNAISKSQLLFDSARLGDGAVSAFHTVKSLTPFGRQWTVVVRSLPAFDARLKYEKANLIAIAGSIGTLLLALVVWLLVTGRERALSMAEEMTKELRQSEDEQRKLNRALRLLSDCNMALVHAEEEHELLEEICRLIVVHGGYLMAWVGYAEQDETKAVRPVAHYGREEGYLSTVQITWADAERGRGPTGTAIRTGMTQANHDFLNNPLMTPWRADALKRGYQSSTALPLKDASGIFGALTIYSAEPKAFFDAELLLIQELADDLAFGVAALRIKTARQQAEEALRQSEERLRQLNQSLEQRVQEEITKNREKDLLLIQQSRMVMMGEMMRGVAHHWRQPLNTLNIILANIKDAYEYGELTQEALNKLVADGNRVAQKMSATIDDFRDFFRTSEEITRFSLVEAIREAVRLMEPTLKNEKIEIALETSQDVFVEGVLLELSHVLLNVLINAKDAIKAKGELGDISIWLEQENNMGVIHIRDSGGGIPENILPNIFDPYFTTKESGTGIGLYMSRMMLERMKGNIRARNTQGGLEVIISVPAVP